MRGQPINRMQALLDRSSTTEESPAPVAQGRGDSGNTTAEELPPPVTQGWGDSGNIGWNADSEHGVAESESTDVMAESYTEDVMCTEDMMEDW